ncbi:DNA cytosine methyltransferase [Lachnoanaerobaculum gingivalis]|uniref:DNA cytosine methyltransferase n=1 Tax=Lachnoanaerobaculum gingivalis TaxID=2490855 RepID=UPI0028D304C6|nr:DNA cytosine methyltransferase [Lachnoanaerobaculum gingivalis]
MGNKITMGSLFSGSGGFELAGQMSGIVPVWASEIEPFPILVTTTHFPDMEHFGDIKKMNGGLIPKVDIITGGSPCQDMSIAGKREGLDGSRSNLFREQIRIVKEMRESDKADGRTGSDIRPRFMVWGNVPGAFSSNKGEDFRCVLEEICRVTDAEVSIPRPPKGKWRGQGTIMGDGYSVAWRTLDAQYWGVPQRRKRIYLVADFGGGTAPEILFEQDSLRGDTKESSKERKDTATGAEDGSYKSDGANDEHLNNSIKAFHITQDPISMKISPCLTQGNSNTGQATIGVVIPVMDKASRYKSQKTANGFGVGDEDDPAYTLTTADRHSIAYSIDRAAFNQGVNTKYDIGIAEDIAQTIVAKGPGAVAHETYAIQSFGEYKPSGRASSIKQRDFKDATDLVVVFEPGTVSRVGGHYYEDGKAGTIRAKPGDNQQTIINDYIVRRLTPTECGRLQGFPDGWTDNLAIAEPTEEDILYWRMIFKENAEALGEKKKEKTDNQIRKWLQNPERDSAKYKMWGNGIALPCATFVMKRVAQKLQRRRMKEITINVPDGTQLLHLLAVIDKGKEIHYETKFCDLRDSKLEYTLNSCNKEGE